MEFIEEAGMLEAINNAGFQRKTGANFQRNGSHSSFDFREKFSTGPGETFQVERGKFDKILADEASRMGADIRYRHEITSVDLEGEYPRIACKLLDSGLETCFHARYLFDASGFARVLPRLLELEAPSDFPVRSSLFCHVQDNIDASGFDREKILITVHPDHRDVWYWLIPFSGGRCSLGVVAEPRFLANYRGDAQHKLMTLVNEDAYLGALLAGAKWDTPVREITGYSANVTRLATDKYALLGNAGEFLDPVFSSGVTIAMRSASLATATLQRQLQGEPVDWQEDYALPLQRGVDTFRHFVSAWYDTRLQDIIFYPQKSPEIGRKLSSILAGYAWDENNPYVAQAERRLNALWQYCKPATA
jgi:flavin-dependent dehydrogenase